MIVWIVVIDGKRGLNATVHEDAAAARQYVRHLYGVPEYIAGGDVLGWVGANSEDRVLIDYDELAR